MCDLLCDVNYCVCDLKLQYATCYMNDVNAHNHFAIVSFELQLYTIFHMVLHVNV